jgi:predicted transposase YdaD
MVVLQESPWYQQILREGERSLILKILNRRFGNLAPEIAAQVQALSIEQLEALGEDLLDFGQPEDLVTWLATNSG